jgi:hypothetical protein
MKPRSGIFVDLLWHRIEDLENKAEWTALVYFVVTENVVDVTVAA